MRLFKMDFKLVFAFLVCLTVKVSGQLPGLPPPGNLPIPQSIGTLPPIGTPGNVVPPTQNMAFTPANQPATSPPWMASAQSGGNIPTVPTVPPSTTSVVTFISVSGSFPSVSIPDNGYDDHYVTIKSMFDTYYPNVPPLRRVENRATLQIFQGSSGVAGTAVVSDDPTTIYIQYILPQQNAYAYLPFTTDSTRRLKYPERPIYLPYPQLAVRVPATGEIYPVYIPFQPNENRRNSEEPEMFIPSIVPGSNVPLYEAALPAQTVCNSIIYFLCVYLNQSQPKKTPTNSKVIIEAHQQQYMFKILYIKSYISMARYLDSTVSSLYQIGTVCIMHTNFIFHIKKIDRIFSS